MAPNFGSSPSDIAREGLMAGDLSSSDDGLRALAAVAYQGVAQMREEDGSTLLVAELHHRVMNSFQVISALAQRCARVRDLTDLPPVIDDLNGRLSAFAALHRQLATEPSGCFAAYCLALGANLLAAFGRSDVVHVTMEPVGIGRASQARVALIVVELLTNCLKHSLVSAAVGSILIDLRTSDDWLVIEVQDSAAPPVPGDRPPISRVVSALATSLGGDARVIDRAGYCVQVTLPLFALEARAGGRSHGTEPVALDDASPRHPPVVTGSACSSPPLTVENSCSGRIPR